MRKSLLILLLFFLIASCENKIAHEGKPAPEFVAINNRGENLNLPKFQGKKVYLNFWTITCKPCLEDFYNYQSLIDSINSSPTQTLIHVCLDANHTQIANYLSRHQLTLSNSYTASNPDDIISKYNIGAFPHHVVINESGIVIKNDYRKMFEEMD